MQIFQKLKITTPANENQADFGLKDTKINPRSLPPEAITWYPAGGLYRLICVTCASAACPRAGGDMVSVKSVVKIS